MSAALAQSESVAVAQDSTEQVGASTMLGTYYSDRFVGRKTSTGEVFRQNQYTAAHKTIPFGTYLLVNYPVTNLSIVVRVNDRCPKAGVLDMTKIACKSLGIKGSGKVSVTVLDPAMGALLCGNQDTTWMSREDYLAFRDRSQSRRISPYRLSPDDKPTTTPKANPARPAPPQKTNNQKLTTSTAIAADTVEEVVEIMVDTVAEPVRPAGPLYDIDLCVVGSQNVANMEANRIPSELQDKVVFIRNEVNREVRILLQLADTRSHAVRTQAMLIDLFPDCCVVPHHK